MPTQADIRISIMQTILDTHASARRHCRGDQLGYPASTAFLPALAGVGVVMVTPTGN